MNETNSEGLFEGWVILELLGHRKLGGYLKEESIAGASFLRLDVISDQGESVATQFYSASAVYCITPVVKELAIAFGAKNHPVPVTRWELPKPVPLPPHPDDATFPDEDTEEDDYDDDNY
jgi:hypothetical protein